MDHITDNPSFVGQEGTHTAVTVRKLKKPVIIGLIIVAVIISMIVIVAVTVLLVDKYVGESGMEFEEVQDGQRTGEEDTITQCDQMAVHGLMDSAELREFHGWKKLKFSRDLVKCEDIVKEYQIEYKLPGIYFTSLSIGTARERRARVRIADQNNITYGELTRMATIQQASETISKTFLINLNNRKKRSSILKLEGFSEGYGHIFDRKSYLMTAWSGFRMDSLMKLKEVFYLERTSSLALPGIVEFDQRQTIVGNGVSISGSRFTVKYPGMYFLSVNLAVGQTSNRTRVSLQINSMALFHLGMSGVKLNGMEPLSQAAIEYLYAGEVVDVFLEEGEIIGSMHNSPISLTGFLYEPISNKKVAWYVHRTEPWFAVPGPPFDPVTYDGVGLNEGGAYNSSSHHVVLPYSGIYFVHVSVGVPSDPPSKMWLQIRHNGENIGSVARFDDSPNVGEKVVSRGILFEGEEGDTLHVWADSCPTCALMSTTYGKETSFMGMLVSPKRGSDSIF